MACANGAIKTGCKKEYEIAQRNLCEKQRQAMAKANADDACVKTAWHLTSCECSAVVQPVSASSRFGKDFFVAQLFQDPLQLSAAAMKQLKRMIDRGNFVVPLDFLQEEQHLFFQCLCRSIHYR